MSKKVEITKAGKSKMTVMLVQLEGDDQTLQEGIRTISQAIGNMMNPARALAPKLKSPELAETSEGEQKDVEAEMPEVEQNHNGDDFDSTASRSSRSPSKPRNPQVIDIDLKSATVPLKDFCAQKGITDSESDVRKYVAIAFWLKEDRKISDVTMDHIHTCYKILGWPTPRDAAGPLRMGKHNGWYSKGDGKGSYSINHVGENIVTEMGKSK